jgi:CBS domain-containing protein
MAPAASAPRLASARGWPMVVKELMTRKVFTLRADQKALEAHEIMDWAYVRHVPVV